MTRTKRHMNMKLGSIGGKSRRRSSGRSRRRRGGQEMMQSAPASTSSSIVNNTKGFFSNLGADVSSMWGKAKQSATGAWGSMTGNSNSNSMGGYRATKRNRRGGQVVGFDGDWKEYGPAVGGRRRKHRGGQVVGFDGDWKEYGPAVGGRRRKRRGGDTAKEEEMAEGNKSEDMGGRRRKRGG